MLLIGGGQAAAQTTTTSFKSTCRASATINVDKTKDDSVIVNAPTTVVSGETFTFTIQRARLHTRTVIPVRLPAICRG